jgi:ring-1,2-phenylacetyl-CoA epoxidase subunit PaaE
MKQYTITIQEIRKETEDTITLSFKQPGLRKIKYLAGQYITLILRINGRKYARAYSFSSAPSVDATIDVTVKRVPGGVVSNYINTELKVGDVVEVLEPIGNFIYQPSDVEKVIYMWGVGSGITPLYSLTKEILYTYPNTKIHLIYGNKRKESSIFLSEIVQLQQKFQSKFKTTHFFSQEDTLNESEGFSGRISSSFVANLLFEKPNYIESLHYICGPNGLKETIKNAIIQSPIPESSIFSEEFELVIDPRELYDVVDSKATIDFQGQQVEIFIPKGKSVLDVSLDNGIELPYSCQTGNCSTCKAILSRGSLKMIGLDKERLDLSQDEFLLCCSYPLGSEVNIEVK